MKQLTVLIMLLCIAVLPVSGQSLAHADEHSGQPFSTQSDMVDHCPTHELSHADEGNDHAEHSTSAEKQIGQLHDCCDGTHMCSSGDCPADCGHCKAPGHGHCATLSANVEQNEPHENNQWQLPAGYHSRTLIQPTPPPNHTL